MIMRWKPAAVLTIIDLSFGTQLAGMHQLDSVCQRILMPPASLMA
jgi:hypothetical protein